jgi:pyrroline-5-carboxylate reductase
MTNQTILLVGCGKMGGALLMRWDKTHGGKIFVVDPHAKEPCTLTSLAALPASTAVDVVVFAVKPQELTPLLAEYKARFGAKPLYLSIAAGKTLAYFALHLGGDARVVRAMPNTPALIGRGVTALTASHNVSPQERKSAEALMAAAGKTVWVDESQMDAVTALSGSGPAYVFLFLESLTKAGVAAGLSEDTAKALAVETVAGSAALAQQSGEELATLRQNVTSKGGTTEAALSILLGSGGLEPLVKEAVKAAAKRAVEMNN